MSWIKKNSSNFWSCSRSGGMLYSNVADKSQIRGGNRNYCQRNIEEAIKTAIQTAKILTEEQK